MSPFFLITVICTMIILSVIKHNRWNRHRQYRRYNKGANQQPRRKNQVTSYGEDVDMGDGLYNEMLDDYYAHPHMQIQGTTDAKSFIAASIAEGRGATHTISHNLDVERGDTQVHGSVHQYSNQVHKADRAREFDRPELPGFAEEFAQLAAEKNLHLTKEKMDLALRELAQEEQEIKIQLGKSKSDNSVKGILMIKADSIITLAIMEKEHQQRMEQRDKEHQQSMAELEKERQQSMAELEKERQQRMEQLEKAEKEFQQIMLLQERLEHYQRHQQSWFLDEEPPTEPTEHTLN